jgi:hypothetical protein
VNFGLTGATEGSNGDDEYVGWPMTGGGRRPGAALWGAATPKAEASKPEDS